MKQQFSDRASFLKMLSALRDATFFGRDLVFDEGTGTMTLTVTRTDTAGGGGGFPWGRKPSYLRTAITVRNILSYKQYLTAGQDDVYVLDRAEVGRAGRELAFYFRPGDRAVMDVAQIEGRVEDTGKATSAPRKPVIVNPLLSKERKTGKNEG